MTLDYHKSHPYGMNHDREVTILPAGRRAREEHGEAFGAQFVRLTAPELRALENGGQLAISIMSGEYVLSLESPKSGDTMPGE